MAITTHTLSGNVKDLLGDSFDVSRQQPFLTVTLIASEALFSDGGTGLRVGNRQQATIGTGGSVTFAGVPSSAGGFPMYQLHVKARSEGGKPVEKTTGWFEMTANRTLAWVVENAIEPAMLTPAVRANIEAAAALGATNDTATASFVTNPASATAAALAAKIAGSTLRGNVGEGYGVVACVIRQDSQGSGWYAIGPTPGNVNSNHVPVNVSGVTTNNGNIILQYGGMGALGVASLVVCPDETFAAKGFSAGASVAKDIATIMVYRDLPMSDRIYWDGSAWLSADGVFAPSWDAGTGVLTLNHGANPVPNAQRNSVSLAARGTTVRPVVSSAASATGTGLVKVSLINNSTGAIVTAPTVGMDFFATHGQRQEKVDAADVFDPGGNFWIIGVFPLTEAHPEA